MELVSKMRSFQDKPYNEAAAFLKMHLKTMPTKGIVTGSGLGRIIQDINDPVRIPYTEIPHFPRSTVAGHAGELVVGELCGKSILVFCGRVHYYEGYSFDTIVMPIQILALLGLKLIIITNAAGAINPDFAPGDIVSIRGHLDLMQSIPLNLLTPSEIYDLELIDQAKNATHELGLPYKSGIYGALSGPSYETPAEINALEKMGVDMVGMSTVPEAIEAHRLGLKVLGLSFISNLAAGLNPVSLSHQEVIDTSAQHLPVHKQFLKQMIKTL